MVYFFFSIHFLKKFSRDVKRGVRRGYPAINGGLQQHFLDLVASHAVVESRFYVHAKFVATIQSDHHGECQQAASMAGQAGTRPYLAPGAASDEVLEFAIEICGRGQGSVHVRIAQNRPPDLHALLVTVGIIHGLLLCLISLLGKKATDRLCECVSLLDIREVSCSQFKLFCPRNLIRKEMSFSGRYD